MPPALPLRPHGLEVSEGSGPRGAGHTPATFSGSCTLEGGDLWQVEVTRSPRQVEGRVPPDACL